MKLFVLLFELTCTLWSIVSIIIFTIHNLFILAGSWGKLISIGSNSYKLWDNHISMCVIVSALWGKSKPSRPYNKRHGSGVDLIDQFVRAASVVFTIASFTQRAIKLTCLCLETSLLMQRSHWHLMSQHFSWKLVSGISTATTNSVPCIVGLLKPRRCHNMVT